MFTRRLIAVATIALLTSAVPASVSAQHRRRQPPCPPPAKTYECPPQECPPYPLVEPKDSKPARDEPAPAPQLDSDQPAQPDQQTQPQAPDLARPTFTPSQSTTAATSSQSAAPNMIGDMLAPTAGISLICIQPDTFTFIPAPIDANMFTQGTDAIGFALNGDIANFGKSTLFLNQSTFYYEEVIGASNLGGTSFNPVITGPGTMGTNVTTPTPAFTFTSVETAENIGDLSNLDTVELDKGSPQFVMARQTHTLATKPGLQSQANAFAAANSFTGTGVFTPVGGESVEVNGGEAEQRTDNPPTMDQTDNTIDSLAIPPTTNTIAENGDFVSGESPDEFAVTQDAVYTPGMWLFTPDPYDVTPPVIKIPIVNPASAPGALVGRQKIGENTSPLPRRRVFFNYSHFDSANIAPGGVDVNRYTPGLEWTFFDDNMSVEVRTPFASTLDSTMILGGRTSTDEVEFGNVTLNLKALLYVDEVFAMSTGLGIALPTADDVDVNSLNGTRLVTIDNEAVHLLPFLGALWTPNDRCFAQAYVQFDFDTNGNPVGLTSFNNGVATGNVQSVGIANDATLAYIDLSLGYWIYQNFNSCAKISGIAPIVELHFTGSVSDADIIRSSSGSATYQIGTNEDLEVLNAVFGLTTVLCDTSTLTLGYATPISEDEQFDGEFRAMLNIFFGGSSRTSALGNRRFIQF